jgi:hypothetical protein
MIGGTTFIGTLPLVTPGQLLVADIFSDTSRQLSAEDKQACADYVPVFDGEPQELASAVVEELFALLGQE